MLKALVEAAEDIDQGRVYSRDEFKPRLARLRARRVSRFGPARARGWISAMYSMSRSTCATNEGGTDRIAPRIAGGFRQGQEFPSRPFRTVRTIVDLPGRRLGAAFGLCKRICAREGGNSGGRERL